MHSREKTARWLVCLIENVVAIMTVVKDVKTLCMLVDHSNFLKGDSRPAPAAQTALNQEQQKKKKQKQQQQVSEKQHKEPHPKQTSGASPQPKPTQGASGTTPTTSDKQVAASKKIPAAPSAIRFGQALSNPRPPNSDKLESAKQFIEAWNDADLAKGSSTSASPHPAGPSRMFQSLHSVQARHRRRRNRGPQRGPGQDQQVFSPAPARAEP